MSDRILGKYTDRTSSNGAADAAGVLDNAMSDADGTEDCGAFGWLRGVRDRAIMIELRKKTGDVLAIAYGYIDRIAFDPSCGIVLHLGAHKIQIKGRNLNAELRPHIRLFQGMTRHRVPWIREGDRAEKLQGSDHHIVIDSIDW